MTPQKRGVVPTAEEQRLRAAVVGAEAAEKELRAAVVAALVAGGSVREVARVSGISVNTIERWGRAGGWPSKEEVLGKISDLEAQVAAGEAPDFTELKAAVQGVDDIVADVVVPSEPEVPVEQTEEPTA